MIRSSFHGVSFRVYIDSPFFYILELKKSLLCLLQVHIILNFEGVTCVFNPSFHCSGVPATGGIF